MADGKANQGFTYAALYELPGAGIQVMRGHVDPKGSIAVHEGKGQYVLYVISGTGTLTLNGKSGEQIGEVTYKPEDVIVFQPNTLHGWINGDAARIPRFRYAGAAKVALRRWTSPGDNAQRAYRRAWLKPRTISGVAVAICRLEERQLTVG
jgi:quercetin dioxygenase-like cupin family protein